MITSLKDILVVTDMDNTLLTAEQGIPSCNLATIKLFCELGGKFTIATGRTIESAGRYLDKLPLNAPAIVYGGGVIYDFNTNMRIKSALLPKKPAMQALMDIQDAFPGIGIEVMAENGRIYVIQSSPYTHHHTLHEKLNYTVSALQDVYIGWNKVLFACDNETLLRIQRFVSRKQYPGIYFVATNSIYFEIMPEGVTKGKALEQLCAHLQIPIENTIAIGDYYNDINLMQTAGHSVAMGNAPPDVQNIASEVTDTCLNGGVGQYLYKLIKQYT